MAEWQGSHADLVIVLSAAGPRHAVMMISLFMARFLQRSYHAASDSERKCCGDRNLSLANHAGSPYRSVSARAKR